ncbi:MAG: MerR family transcriptional regulator [Deltaproteobacteria bacterium]|nr:MerR family transcriptional regulator [Deltaproteobacteria bacterium]
MKPAEKLLQIGEVAKRSGTTIRTVRYYLEEGFIEAGNRSPGGFYLFNADVVEKVLFIQKLKKLGLPLKEIKSLYSIRREQKTGAQACLLVRGKLQRGRERTTAKIVDYRNLLKELDEAIELVSECEGCRKRPAKENCLACEVVKKRDHIPLPFGAIL